MGRNWQVIGYIRLEFWKERLDWGYTKAQYKRIVLFEASFDLAKNSLVLFDG